MSPSSLRMHSPSPSTTAYLVTNAPPLTSRAARILRYIGVFLRVITALLCVAVLVLEVLPFIDLYQATWLVGAASKSGSQGYAWLNEAWQILEQGKTLARTLRVIYGERAGFWAPVGVCVAILRSLSRRGHVEESLLALRSLGLQTSTSSQSIFYTPTTRFIPTSQIQDIFIHEAFIGFEVRFYLAVIVEGEDEAVVVFPRLLPSRAVLEQVWRGAREVLWGAGNGPRGKNETSAGTADSKI